MACLVSVIIGLLAAWPACLLFGEKSVDIGIEGVEAIDCSTDETINDLRSLEWYFVEP
jgi:hypothetical protein